MLTYYIVYCKKVTIFTDVKQYNILPILFRMALQLTPDSVGCSYFLDYLLDNIVYKKDNNYLKDDEFKMNFMELDNHSKQHFCEFLKRQLNYEEHFFHEVRFLIPILFSTSIASRLMEFNDDRHCKFHCKPCFDCVHRRIFRRAFSRQVLIGEIQMKNSLFLTSFHAQDILSNSLDIPFRMFIIFITAHFKKFCFSPSFSFFFHLQGYLQRIEKMNVILNEHMRNFKLEVSTISSDL